MDMDIDSTFAAAFRRMEAEMDRLWRGTALQQSFSDNSLFDPMMMVPGTGNIPALLSASSNKNGPLVPFNSPSSSTSTDVGQAAAIAKPIPDNRMLMTAINDEGNVRLSFNVANYAPGEIKVSIGDDRYLRVNARHVEETPERSVVREFRQEYLLPPDANVEGMVNSLDANGMLAVDIPRKSGRMQKRIMNN